MNGRVTLKTIIVTIVKIIALFLLLCKEYYVHMCRFLCPPYSRSEIVRTQGIDLNNHAYKARGRTEVRPLNNI